ncbi:unnamed protein product [Prunus armeniaca]|uniref:Uncharacterized protein n=1 Tax=Prunus armeniaca TaxID=36596 RepID=A0A6J5UI00_PRUAR|nr:unnamed protein product [Prunus armeniaca]
MTETVGIILIYPWLIPALVDHVHRVLVSANLLVILLEKPCKPVVAPSESRVRMKDSESPDSRGKKPRRRLFNLELPADEYISDGEEPEVDFMGPGTENYPPTRKNEVTQARDDILSNHIGETSSYNNVLHLERSSGLTDLNEPIQIDRVSASTSVFKFGNDFSSKEEIERQVLSANAYKGVWPFAKEFPENPQMGKDGRDGSSLMCGHDAENWGVEIGDWIKTRKTFALPMFDKVSFPYPCSSSKSGCLASSVDNGYTVRIEFAKSNVIQDPVSHMGTVQLKADGLVLEKRLFNANADSRHQIDLNRCFTEEETERTAASPIMRTETVIDLEAPVIVESDIVGEDSMQRNCKEPLDLPHEMRALQDLPLRL